MLTIQGATIVAIATAIVAQQGSIGIVRLSGERAVAIAKKIFHAVGKQTWSSHQILYGYIQHPETKQTIDEALLLLMLAPRSYTKEDVVEFHCHGGIIAVQEVLQLCVQQGAKLAQPGEFTLRAFLNGRIDLTQAESVAELVSAQSSQASQVALAGLKGKLAHPIQELRKTCLDILAEVEARIDFEDDLPPLDENSIRQQIQELLSKVESILATADRGELLRSGLKVAIVGRPNVGKSSLLNTWSRSDRAIVTELPGTTRDVIESTLVVGGIPVQVLDTAGIRDTCDTVEKIGVERSRKAAESADLVLLTIDAEKGWTAEDNLIYQQVKNRPLILIINKIDLATPDNIQYPPEIKSVVMTAAAQNEGINALETAILDAVKTGNLEITNSDIAINQRQATTLYRVQNALNQVQETIQNNLPLDFWTIDLRAAIQALGEITGEGVTESVLDRIFSRFCIGK
ncbi:tRNA modification GTPase MnmE [Hyella patelloides LEGE 07179]|uniref:tRNA modification GTPase MnmE n=1 Tax=Hyella patelloides LEGE 07179 TaxID=945734 RepID=A0A563VKZ5_9CYAN|nr:tRNA uridine-5-carboxymethylaminomethyl(34) synthesis GTPase MnmE [Hyella patelloides]VEP12017.1 tRNA modification GTPase MnmE [Hyella patelloides LEGE 07179]